MSDDVSHPSARVDLNALARETRVLLLPPTRRDGEAIVKLMRGVGIDCTVYGTMDELCAALGHGAGAVVISEESLVEGAESLSTCVASQPVWSDLPVLVLSRWGAESPRLTASLAGLGNVSVVERPVRINTLLSLIRSAIRARNRQYEVGIHLVELDRAETRLRESEHRFRLMADSIPNLAWTARPDGHVYWYNRRWFEYTGTTPEQMEGWGWQSVHDPEVLPKVLERWRLSLVTGEFFEMEYPLKGADGTFRMFLTRVAPVWSTVGEIVQWVGTSTDISEQQRAGAERERLLNSERAARSAAEQAGRIKDEFLATLSHELRTPLNAIVGWTQIIQSGRLDPADVAEGVEVIARNSRVQAKIIEDLLDMSRIINGKMRLDVQRIDVSDVIRAAVETVGPAAAAKEIRVDLALEPRAGIVRGDAARLQQVFWNLLSNSIKFTPKGGGVKILLERTDAHVEVSIIDTGEGVAPEFLPYIFDRFRQADASITRRHGGLGLGLAIVKQLVELHGGTIRVHSAGGGLGSTFVVALPLIAAYPEKEPAPGQRHPAAAVLVSSSNDQCLELAGVRVLIVDDEHDARDVLQRLLEGCKAVVTVASSAEQGFSLVQRMRPDVLISDIGMPGGDGYSLIRRVRALTPEAGGRTPAIALTAYARSEDRIQSVRAGFQHHIAKPVESIELIATVASLVRR